MYTSKVKLPPRLTDVRTDSMTRHGDTEEKESESNNDTLPNPPVISYAAMKSSKTSLELTSELTSSVSAMMSMISDVMRNQREIIDRLSSVEADLAHIKVSLASPVTLPLRDNRNKPHGYTRHISPDLESKRDYGDSHILDSDATPLDNDDRDVSERNDPTSEPSLPVREGVDSIVTQSEALEDRLLNTMRPGGFELVSESSYGGISEDKYFSTFFMQVMDLYTNLLVSLFNTIQRKCEEDHKIVYTSDASSHYTRTRRILSVLSKHDSFNASIPDKRDAGHRLVAHALRRREKNLYGIVNGYTFLTMSKNASTTSVFRAFCNLLSHLKRVPESMPQPSMTIIKSLDVRICDDDGNILVDYDQIVRASRLQTSEVSLSKTIDFAQISDYVKCRLSGMDPEESLECVRRLSDGSRDEGLAPSIKSSYSANPPSDTSTVRRKTKNAKPKISLRPCLGPLGENK